MSKEYFDKCKWIVGRNNVRIANLFGKYFFDEKAQKQFLTRLEFVDDGQKALKRFLDYEEKILKDKAIKAELEEERRFLKDG